MKFLLKFYNFFYFYKVIIFFAIYCGFIPNLFAHCEKSELLGKKLITDVCWECILPIVVSQVPIGGSLQGLPQNRSNKHMCVCKDSSGFNIPGIATGFWEPARLIEFQLEPGCMSAIDINLGGLSSKNFNRLKNGSIGERTHKMGDKSFLHYHYYAFPLLEMMNMFTSLKCNSDGYNDMDVLYFSELDPTWNDDTLAFFTNPEAILVSNPVSATACSADALSILTNEKPIQSLFWCAGSWGNLYPLSGNISMPTSILKSTSLMTAKVLASLHRRGNAMRTFGNDAMCNGVVDVELPKDQYKFNLIYPIAESNKSHILGESELKWGINKLIPATGELPIYMIFRWHDCCNTLEIQSY